MSETRIAKLFLWVAIVCMALGIIYNSAMYPWEYLQAVNSTHQADINLLKMEVIRNAQREDRIFQSYTKRLEQLVDETIIKNKLKLLKGAL